MKKILSILILAVALVSCGTETAVETSEASAVADSVTTPEPAVVGGFNAKIADAPLANPVFMYGSDFLTFFKSLRKMGKFDTMLKFTSSGSIEKHGADEIKEFYKDKYKNVSEVQLKSKTENEDGSITLFYTNINMATKNAIDITVVIENDTAKLVLPETLRKFP